MRSARSSFCFPNKFNVYLHDTANRALFDQSNRALSHGCIRVQNPLEFAKLLYRLDGNSALSKIDGIVASKQTKGVNFQRPIPVHLTYFTSWVKGWKGSVLQGYLRSGQTDCEHPFRPGLRFAPMALLSTGTCMIDACRAHAYKRAIRLFGNRTCIFRDTIPYHQTA